MKSDRKRLIEVSLPLKAISAQSVREKSIRHGHISTLHIWWARRPLLIPAPDTNALEAPALYLVQDPAHRLPREEVVPRVRYRVAQQGWHRVAKSAVEYEIPLRRKE